MIYENRYSRPDRILHRVAFRLGMAQEAIADVEAALYRKTLEAIQPGPPVFITALPRAGTTILLNVLWETGRFASHTYRDMPFVLCPLFWSRFSGAFRTDDEPRERAHGDGLQVSGESPEAFEEMIWKHFWPAHYEDDRILPWEPRESHAEFDEFFELHMRKVIAVRRDRRPEAKRYLSKNNLNIARLACRSGPLGTGTVVVPFREPVQHAASMLRQHRRFLEIHAQDDFTRRYMQAIGHHEFGQDLRPVDFGGWLSREGLEPDGLPFWIRYWIAAYEHVLDHLDSTTVVVSYARLTEDPRPALGRLAEAVAVAPDLLAPQADRLHPPREHDVDLADVPGDLLDECEAVHGRLREAAVV